MPWQTAGNLTYTNDKVGIGTTTPSIHLDVVGGGDLDPKQGVVRIRSQQGGEAPALQFMPGQGSAWNIYGGLGQGVFIVADTATNTQRFGIDPTQNRCYLQNERGKPVILQFWVPYYGEFNAPQETSWEISADSDYMHFAHAGQEFMKASEAGLEVKNGCFIDNNCRVGGSLSVGSILDVAERLNYLEQRVRDLEAKISR